MGTESEASRRRQRWASNTTRTDHKTLALSVAMPVSGRQHLVPDLTKSTNSLLRPRCNPVDPSEVFSVTL